MLIGEFIAPLGDKNRIALPKNLRDQLGDRLYLTRGYEGSLMMMDQQRWQTLWENINTQPLLNMNVRDTKRFLFGGTFTLNLDSQGRFVVPEALVEFAGLQEKVVFLGVGEWLELWSYETWQAKLRDLSLHATEIADRLTL